MIYDREGRTLWIADETGRRRPATTWDEVNRMPRGTGMPDWWLEAREPGWTPPDLVDWENGKPPSLGTGRSLLTMTEADHRALTASGGFSAGASSGGGSGGGGSGGGADTKLGCGGKCQERYDTATGKYTGSAGGGSTKGKGGGTPGDKSGGAKTPAPKAAPAKAPAPQAQPTTYHKAAGADRTPPNYNKGAGTDSQMARARLPENNPVPPQGVNVDDNIREAEAHKGNLVWFYTQVDSHGSWDYKNIKAYKKDGSFENFGNFNYGATGAALGVPDEILYRAAGAKQSWDHRNDPPKRTDLLRFPYGDEHKDAEMIRRGIEYYRRKSAAQQFTAPSK